MFDFGVGVDGWGRGRGNAKLFTPQPAPSPSPYYLLLLTPLVQISFISQSSTVVKIKDGGHNFRYENTEHSLVEIPPALLAVF